MDTYEDAIYHARLCELAERHRCMVDRMKQAISAMKTVDGEAVAHTRNLFSLAFKNLAGTKRSSYRLLNTEHRKQDGQRAQIALAYRSEVENELCLICDEVCETIKTHILDHPSFQDSESKVFFLKMNGDYLRYKAEVCEAMPEYAPIAESSEGCYLKAIEAAKDLKPTNPVKLGLALNYSVFLYEIRKDYARACACAKEAFDAAIAGLDELSENYYQDSTLIMQLLRDNMSLWTNQEEATKNNEDEEEARRQAENQDEPKE